jgi:hypothetical protein
MQTAPIDYVVPVPDLVRARRGDGARASFRDWATGTIIEW